MLLVLYQTSGERCGAFSENLDRLSMTLDDFSGKGDFRGVIKRLRDQRGWERLKGSTGVAGGCHVGNGVVHVQSKELSLKHHLKLMVERMVEFNVKGS